MKSSKHQLNPYNVSNKYFLLCLLTFGALLVPVAPNYADDLSTSSVHVQQPQNYHNRFYEDNGEKIHSKSHSHRLPHHHHHHKSHNWKYYNFAKEDYSNFPRGNPDIYNHQPHHSNHHYHHSQSHHHSHNSNHFNFQQDIRNEQFPPLASSAQGPLYHTENNGEGEQQDGPSYNSNGYINTNKYGQSQKHGNVGNCRLPDSWKGRWFQSGIPNPILIDSKFIEGKGTCYESSGDKFLFVEKKTCCRCLVINVRHRNVLEYKESSFCEENDSLENLCLQIPGDAQLYSLFRIDAQPIDCPFKGPFLFSYNRGHGDCKSPMSNVDVCTDPSKLLLRYQACPDVPRTESTTEELQCLAEWRDSAYHYLVGKLNYKLAASNEDRYRCFIYERGKDHVIRIAESGDATCAGLASPSEGARTLTFQKVHESTAKCKFPSWIVMHHWVSLDGKLIVRTGHKNDSMIVTTTDDQHHSSNRFSSNHGTYTRAYTGHPFGNAPINQDTNDKYIIREGAHIQCQSRVDINEEHVAILAQHRIGCSTKTLCMHIFRRDDSVIEIQIREKGSSRFDDYECGRPDSMNPDFAYVTLVTSGGNSRRCPYLGKYMAIESLVSSSPNGDPCRSHHHSDSVGGRNSFYHHHGSFHSLVVGCGHRATMDFHSKCLSHEPITSYECIGSWENNGMGFLIASQTSRSSSSSPDHRYCFSYSETDEGLQVYSSSDSCIREGSPKLERVWTFNLTVDGQCAEPVTAGGDPGVSANRCDSNVILILLLISPAAGRLILYSNFTFSSHSLAIKTSSYDGSFKSTKVNLTGGREEVDSTKLQRNSHLRRTS